jgi:hypothetical protein
MDANLQTFIRFTANRSQSNLKAIEVLCNIHLYGQAISILRQELDSLTRVSHLLSISDSTKRQALINENIRDIKWHGLTDRKLVEAASVHNTWVTDVYNFGNRFTHLTGFHDYNNDDPVKSIPAVDKDRIKDYLSSIHQFPRDKELTFDNAVSYIPAVAQKVARNLASYLDSLQNM